LYAPQYRAGENTKSLTPLRDNYFLYLFCPDDTRRRGLELDHAGSDKIENVTMRSEPLASDTMPTEAFVHLGFFGSDVPKETKPLCRSDL
jgi:hypothetical protein